MKKRLVSFLLLSLVACGDTVQMSGVTLDSSYEGGQRYAAGAVTVLDLHGTHHQMGRQYGMLMKHDMNSLYHTAINRQYIGRQKFTYARLKQIAEAVYHLFPQQQKDILIGMSETSGLGLEKQIVLNALEMSPKYDYFVPRLCSGIAVWGDHTAEGPLLFGRNNDDEDYYREFAADTVVAVYHPSGSGQPTAIINYAGVIYAPTGMNRDGVFLELNSGNVEWIFPDRPLIVSRLFSFPEEYPTLSALHPALLSLKGNATLGSIVNVADGGDAQSYEISAFRSVADDVRRRGPDRPGLLVATNHSVDPVWGLPLPPPTPPMQGPRSGATTCSRSRNGTGAASMSRR